MTEIINIDGENYTFKYSTCDDGNRMITVSYETNENVDVIVYDSSSSTVYLNDEVLATVETETDNLPQKRSNWKLISTSSSKISWAAGTTTAVVAAAIAAVISVLGPAAIIAQMGLSTLSILASNVIGGTVKTYVYNHTIWTSTFRIKWWFTASTGSTYGPFES